jgi:hypothetical protein
MLMVSAPDEADPASAEPEPELVLAPEPPPQAAIERAITPASASAITFFIFISYPPFCDKPVNRLFHD